MMRRNTGFSLIELVVVIVLIGILASVAMPRMFQSINKAYVAAVQGFGSSLTSSLDTWRADYLLTGSAFVSGNTPLSVDPVNKFPKPQSDQDCINIASAIGGLSASSMTLATFKDTTKGLGSVVFPSNPTNDYAVFLDSATSTCNYVYLKNGGTPPMYVTYNATVSPPVTIVTGGQ